MKKHITTHTLLTGFAAFILMLTMHSQAQAQAPLKFQGEMSNSAQLASPLGIEGTSGTERTNGFFHVRKWLGLGAVVGGPFRISGQNMWAGRIAIMPTKLGIVADYSRYSYHDAQGNLTDQLDIIRGDLRWMNGNRWHKILRTYQFGGATLVKGMETEQAILGQAGLGAELRIWRFTIGGELGVSVPIEQTRSFDLGIQPVVSANFMFWLF